MCFFLPTQEVKENHKMLRAHERTLQTLNLVEFADIKEAFVFSSNPIM